MCGPAICTCDESEFLIRQFSIIVAFESIRKQNILISDES